MTVVATWKNGDATFVAIASKVYDYSANVLVPLPRMRYPSCLRFMPYATDFSESNASRADIARTYGKPQKRGAGT